MAVRPAWWPRTLYGQGQAHILDTPYGHGDVHRLEVLTRQRSLNFTPGSRVLYVNSEYDADAFTSTLGFAVFQRNATGRLTGFDLTQSGVWNLRFDRTDGP